jgi:hypothetical protein
MQALDCWILGPYPWVLSARGVNLTTDPHHIIENVLRLSDVEYFKQNMYAHNIDLPSVYLLTFFNDM